MPDSAALKMRRSRRHQIGDHSLCLPTRCDVRRTQDVVSEKVLPGPGVSVLDAVAMWESSVDSADHPQRVLLFQCAKFLARELDESNHRTSPGIVRELRQVVSDIMQSDDVPNGITGIRARRAERHVRMMLNGLTDERNPS